MRSEIEGHYIEMLALHARRQIDRLGLKDVVNPYPARSFEYVAWEKGWEKGEAFSAGPSMENERRQYRG